VKIGCLILEKISGLVSTEVDAKYSFDVERSVIKAKHFLKLYHLFGVDRKRILIKLGTTYEGTQACRQLQAEGINCNMTLVFTWEQALMCHHSNAYLISPFVNRQQRFKLLEDPNYSRHYGCEKALEIELLMATLNSPTIVMFASLKDPNELVELLSIDHHVRVA